ncbi:MAG TPA: hypothetical protein PLX89_14475 [Verrucomicrobiota bacterium]|nr:hypothetical protein [Verrucomicrobiales bacterium]HRI14198.1 hypothetical protein [Verrucomicrobiota bacterium]
MAGLSRFCRFVVISLLILIPDLAQGQPTSLVPTAVPRPTPASVPRLPSPEARPVPVQEIDPTTGIPLPPQDVGPRLDFSFKNLPLEEAIKVVQATYRKESGNYLNVMIPEHLRDLARTNFLTLDVKQVTVGELFNLLGKASQRTVPYLPGPGYGDYRIGVIGYSLGLVGINDGNLTYLLGATFPPGLVATGPGGTQAPAVPASNEPPRSVQFYQLDPYLDRFTVDDITTAVKTGWDLAGYRDLPVMKYHNETKLLIVSGQPDQVAVLEQVLRGLAPAPGRPSRRLDPVPTAQPVLPPKSEKP